MPKLTFAEFCRALADGLFDHWLRELGITVDDLRALYEVTPAEHAEVFHQINPRVTRDVLPRVLPRLRHRANRSMMGSKMEGVNVAGKSREVRIAAGRTRRESPAKRALLEAGLTDQMVADELKVGRSTVNAWCSGRRPIPAAHKKYLAERHGIPGSVWLRSA